MGTLTYFLGVLIYSAYHYYDDDNLGYFGRQVIMILSLGGFSILAAVANFNAI